VKFAPIAALTKPVDEYRSRFLVDVPASEITRMTVVKGTTKVVVSREPGKDARPMEARGTDRRRGETAVRRGASFGLHRLADLGVPHGAGCRDAASGSLPRTRW
jgi:hypothetical protein